MYTYLIVDDEMIERKGIRMLLSWMNIRENILEASNGEEALEVFENGASHSRYFSDELDAQDFRQKENKCLIYSYVYGIMFLW